MEEKTTFCVQPLPRDLGNWRRDRTLSNFQRINPVQNIKFISLKHPKILYLEADGKFVYIEDKTASSFIALKAFYVQRWNFKY